MPQSSIGDGVDDEWSGVVKDDGGDDDDAIRVE